MKYALPPGLGDVEAVIKRFNTAKNLKSSWDSNLKDAYQYALPNRDSHNVASEGARRTRTVYDSTAVRGVKKFANKIQALIVPSWKNWILLKPGSELSEMLRGGAISQEDFDQVEKDLAAATEVLFDHINGSNMDTAANESFQDLAVSTGAMVIDEGDDDKPLNFISVPSPEVICERGPNGNIESSYRHYDVLGRNLGRLWPKADIPEKIKAEIKRNPEATYKVIYGIVYDTTKGGKQDNLNYHTVAILEKEKHLLYTESAAVTAWVITRMNVLPGETYGRGPVMDVISDILTVNKIVEYTLRNAALAIGGVYTGVSDGVLNPYTASIQPGAIIPVSSNSNTNPTLKALDRAGDFSLGDLFVKDYRDIINDALLVSPFGKIEDTPVRSATEMSLRNKQLIEEVGGSFGRLQTEFVERVVKRCIDILQRRGKFPKIAVNGKEISIKFVSPLARAQDNEDILTLQQYNEIVMTYGLEVMMLGIKVEDIPAYVADKVGLDPWLKRSDAEKAKLQEKVVAMLANMQAQSQAGGEASDEQAA